MQRKALNYIVMLATLSVIGIVLIQFLFLRSSISKTENQFHESVSVALEEVTFQILEYNKQAYGESSDFDKYSLVEKASNNYYIVNVNDRIDNETLKILLTQELKKHYIDTDFEFAVYDCESDKMVYGAYICAESDSCNHEKTYEFPKSDKYTYYFAVKFPDRSKYFNSKLKVWYLTTFLLTLVVFFFGYTLFVIVRQRQLSDIQKNFINNLTHELKTPISSIGLSAKVINDKKILESPDRLFKYTSIIVEQNTRLAKNVEKVLDLASLEKNRLQLKLETLVLDEIIQKSLQHVQHNSDFKFEVHSPDKGLKIIGDKLHISNVFINILENAIKYCNSQPFVKIIVEKQKSHIDICIEDNGIGIPKKLRKKIFQKFYRVSTGNIHDVKGFGLGLDYVKKIIKAHGWKIQALGNPTGGSIFKITIPSKAYEK